MIYSDSFDVTMVRRSILPDEDEGGSEDEERGNSIVEERDSPNSSDDDDDGSGNDDGDGKGGEDDEGGTGGDGGTNKGGNNGGGRNCGSCNRRFCLDYKLPKCKGAKEEDVFATCFRKSLHFISIPVVSLFHMAVFS